MSSLVVGRCSFFGRLSITQLEQIFPKPTAISMSMSPILLGAINVDIASFWSSIATNQSTKRTDTAHNIAGYEQWKKFLEFNNAMTCFHASLAMIKSSKNSLNNDNIDKPIPTQKYLSIY
jgi:hypothetical protein